MFPLFEETAVVSIGSPERLPVKEVSSQLVVIFYRIYLKSKSGQAEIDSVEFHQIGNSKIHVNARHVDTDISDAGMYNSFWITLRKNYNKVNQRKATINYILMTELLGTLTYFHFANTNGNELTQRGLQKVHFYSLNNFSVREKTFHINDTLEGTKTKNFYLIRNNTECPRNIL